MSFGYYGILVIVGIFFLILIFNPNLSCFGKKIKSPFYPLFRKKKKKKIKTEDYGFFLAGNEVRLKAEVKKRETGIGNYKTPRIDENQQENILKKKKLKTRDYGFSLGESSKEKTGEEKEKK